ncbi:MAG: substrate-binding domain-containing protein, partial [Chloroflexota bacterium]
LSVMGFDNIPVAHHIYPSLTTIAQPIHEMGLSTADVLLERLHKPDRETVTLVNAPCLVERHSVTSPGQ